jgi:hypothetical protein
VRVAFLLLAIAVVAGCGSVTERSAEGPTIRAVDRPAPDAHKSVAEALWTVTVESSWDPCEEPPTAENVQACKESEDIERQFREAEERANAEHTEETSPAPGSEPRVVAELPLGEEVSAEVVTWHARNGKACTLARIAPAEAGDFFVQRVGECVRYPQCTELCLAVLTTNDRRAILAGTVTERADLLLLTGPDGREREHDLSGPMIEGTDRRVFITDLGGDEWWSMELRRGGETLATDDMLGHHLRAFRCANVSAAGFDGCYNATPLPPDPSPPDEADEEPERTCERKFDENESGFQTCEDEGDVGESE